MTLRGLPVDLPLVPGFSFHVGDRNPRDHLTSSIAHRRCERLYDVRAGVTAQVFVGGSVLPHQGVEPKEGDKPREGRIACAGGESAAGEGYGKGSEYRRPPEEEVVCGKPVQQISFSHRVYRQHSQQGAAHPWYPQQV